ncbi:VWA domain-containing protein [Actinosynnema sp. NPDC059797]
MNSWIRGNYDGIGLTQSPPGPYLAKVQARFGGTVLLCIDVSGSMTGGPLTGAVEGGLLFLEEAAAAHYRAGLVLWDHEIQLYLPPGAPPADLAAGLREARPSGGTDLVPVLLKCQELLVPLDGDRVVCVFSDGGIGRRDEARALARELCAAGVRIVVRGLGADAAGALAELACPGRDDARQVVVDVGGVSAGIASMASGLTRGARR